MRGLNEIVAIDAKNLRFTAQAGLEMIEAAAELRKQQLQFMLNIEIGNMTLGSAACCHTKDALDGDKLRAFPFRERPRTRIYQFDRSRGVLGFLEKPEDVLRVFDPTTLKRLK